MASIQFNGHHFVLSSPITEVVDNASSPHEAPGTALTSYSANGAPAASSQPALRDLNSSQVATPEASYENIFDSAPSNSAGQAIRAQVPPGRGLSPMATAYIPPPSRYRTLYHDPLTGLPIDPATLQLNPHPSAGTIGDSRNRTAVREAYIREGKFTTEEEATRSFIVTGIPTTTSIVDISAEFGSSAYDSANGIAADELSTNGTVGMSFTDITQAKHAVGAIRRSHPQWQVQYMTPKEYFRHVHAQEPLNVSDYHGQMIIAVRFLSGIADFDTHVMPFLRDLISQYGHVKAIHALRSAQDLDDLPVVLVEYLDTRTTDKAVAQIPNINTHPYELEVLHYRPDLRATHFAPNLNVHELPRVQPISGNGVNGGLPPSQRSPSRASSVTIEVPHAEQQAPQIRDFAPQHGNLALLQNEIRNVEAALARFAMQTPFNSAVRQPPANYRGLGRGRLDIGINHNHVDIDRIRHGLDVRTTIMLRNIPNKIDQMMLKTIIDETSLGDYDFMYLRIDFANNCNVGYAFINFERAESIIAFAQARAGRRWNRYNSDKVAEISYATIQGKDCLVAKFRNSSVMLEHPTFRPKLFTTGNGPMAGREEPFPGPDNHSKMRRSVENAEHVGSSAPSQRGLYKANRHLTCLRMLTLRSAIGLFAPRAGQQYRDEQRRRRSQYDRGTTAAEMENYHQAYNDIYDRNMLPVDLGFMQGRPRGYGLVNDGFNGPMIPFNHDHFRMDAHRREQIHRATPDLTLHPGDYADLVAAQYNLRNLQY